MGLILISSLIRVLCLIWMQLFEFGDKYRGKYDASVGVAKSYYASVSGYMDELLWGAIWLYRATDNEEYLKYVINKAYFFGGIGWAMIEFSWDVKYAGLQIMASKVKLKPLISFLTLAQHALLMLQKSGGLVVGIRQRSLLDFAFARIQTGNNNIT